MNFFYWLIAIVIGLFLFTESYENTYTTWDNNKVENNFNLQ